MNMTATTVKERPILFSSEMINAILAGTKTQTRRIVKPQPTVGRYGATHPTKPSGVIGKTPGQLGSGDYHVWYPDRGPQKGQGIPLVDDCLYRLLPECPYGEVGDWVWVREMWRTAAGLDTKSPAAIAESCLVAGYPHPWAPIRYEADGRTVNSGSLADFDDSRGAGWGKTRVSIHMPRWASRITLEIVGVKVERLQAISVADAEAEGVEWNRGPLRCGHTNPISAFRSLWNSINAPGSWDANPWVWAVEFKRFASQEIPR